MTPFPGFTPQMLAQLAQNAFRPPQGGGAPGMQMPQQGGGFDMGPGMMGLGMGLAAMRRQGDPFMAAERTAGDRDLGGYGASPVDPMSGNPNAMPTEVFNPTGAATGSFGSWLRGLF